MPVVVTCQLSRMIDRRIDKKPYLKDLPEGYELEEYADVVLLIYREEHYDMNSVRKGIADIAVAKQRNGPTGEVNLVFNPAYNKFDSFIPQSDPHWLDIPGTPANE